MSPAKAGGGSFDRVRPRTARPGPGPARAGAAPTDVEGKSALFSTAPPVPAFGSLDIACGGCGRHSVLAPSKAVRALVPSLHLPLLRRNRSLLRCPACGRYQWCHLTLRV